MSSSTCCPKCSEPFVLGSICFSAKCAKKLRSSLKEHNFEVASSLSDAVKRWGPSFNEMFSVCSHGRRYADKKYIWCFDCGKSMFDY